MVDTAAQIWRDYVTDGVPASGVNKPEKLKIREWGKWIETGTGFKTVALFLADATLTEANTPNDTYVMVRENGLVYKKLDSGASDYHVMTAGGLKFDVLPGENGYSVASGISFEDADSLSRPVIVPTVGFTATGMTSLLNTYNGDGSFRLGQLTHNLLDNQAPLADQFSTIGDMTTLDAAIQNGSAKVVFWGDSITEGTSQIAYEDSYGGLIAAYLQDRLPSVSWTVENYSISGSTTADAANASYVGAASDSYPTQFYRAAGSANVGNFQPGTPLWPAGSTVGKPWRQHVRDAAPDLLVIAFGANEVATSLPTYYANLVALMSYINGWTKVPSVVFVTGPNPTRASAPWNGYQDQLSNISSITRSFAVANGCSLIDANRLHHVYRDGFDVCRPSKRLSYNFSGGFTDAWPTGWNSNGMALPTVSGTYNLAFSQPCVTEKLTQERDVSLSAVFVPTVAASSVFGIVYRSAGVSSNDKYTAYLFTSADGLTSTMVLYYNGVAVASGVVTTVTDGEQVQIEVECVGTRHVVKVRGSVSVDVNDYGKLSAGSFGVQWGAGSGVVASWVARVGSYRVVGAPRLSDEIVYGAVNDWTTNDASLGGDTIHHPSAIGHYAVYYCAAIGLLRHVELLSRRPKNKFVVANTTDTTTAIVAGDYFEIVIGGVTFGTVMLTDSAADAALGASMANFQIVTGTSVAVVVFKNGVAMMTETLTLTGGGTYLVIANASVSSKSGTIRHTLSAAAIKV